MRLPCGHADSFLALQGTPIPGMGAWDRDKNKPPTRSQGALRKPRCPCAVPRRRSSVGAIPTWQLLLQPVAIGAVAEVTKLPKLPVERVAPATPRAGRP